MLSRRMNTYIGPAMFYQSV